MALNRVTYGESQSISLDSLTDEQAYQIAMRRRHYLAQHDWGIVSGLNFQPSGGGFVLCRGVAVDGYGRELIVPEDIGIGADALGQFRGNAIAAWLLYLRSGTDGLQYGVYPCGPGSQNRTYEQAVLRLEEVATLAGIDGRNPPQVSVSNLGFGPQGDPPDDPAAVWPVYLGGLSRVSNTAGWAFVTVGRPYSLLRGEMVAGPSGSAQVQVGAEASGDRNRFAITLPPATAPAIAIDLDSNSVLRGDTGIAGKLSMEPAPPASAPAGHDLCAGLETLQERFWGVVFSPVPPPQAATPWNVYHAEVPAPQGAAVQTPTDQLRFEYFDPGQKGDRTAYKCSIGVNRNGAFVPCLSIDAECNLTIYGNLAVKGSLVWGPADANPADPRFQAELLTTWMQGLVGNTAGIAQFYSGSMALAFVDLDDGVVNAAVACTLNIQNTGPFRLEGVRLTETLSIPGATASPAIPAAFALDPSEIKPIARNYTSPAAGSLQVVVHAEGVATPNGYQVIADLQQTIQIFPAFTLATRLDLLPDDMVSGASAHYSATVTDTGAADGQVHFSRTIEVGGISATADLLPAGSPIHAAEAIPVADTFSPATPGNYTITVTAAGDGPGHHNHATHQAQHIVHVHSPVNVTVAVTGLVDGDDGVAQNFTVTVTNLGSEPARVNSVAITASGSALPGIGAFTLNSGAPHISTHTCIPQAPSVTVTATADVTGPGHDPAHPSGSQTVAITIPGPS